METTWKTLDGSFRRGQNSSNKASIFMDDDDDDNDGDNDDNFKIKKI